MRGERIVKKGKVCDVAPCYKCKYKNELTVGVHCYGCISNVDLALHKANHETEFTCFVPEREVGE